jgi:hypothetical protein
VSRLSNISFSLFHFCTYKRRFKLLPLKNKKNGIFGKCANIQISFKVEWPKKKSFKMEICEDALSHRWLKCKFVIFFWKKKLKKNWKAMKVCEEECKVWRPDLFQRLQKLHFIFFFSKRFNWIVKIPKNGTQIHTNWTKNFSLNEIVIKPNIPFYQLFNKVI